MSCVHTMDKCFNLLLLILVMATPPVPKRQWLNTGPTVQVSASHVRTVSQLAQSTPFPWKEAVPDKIAE